MRLPRAETDVPWYRRRKSTLLTGHRVLYTEYTLKSYRLHSLYTYRVHVQILQCTALGSRSVDCASVPQSVFYILAFRHLHDATKDAPQRTMVYGIL